MTSGRRLGVYIDASHRLVETPDGPRLAIDPVDFPTTGIFTHEVGTRFDSLVLFARVHRAASADGYVFLPRRFELAELPDYGDLRQLSRVVGSTLRTALGFWRGLARVDTVWVFGPHPFGLLLIGLGSLRGKTLVLHVRQDTLSYFRARLPSTRWAPTLVVVRGLDAAYRLLARRLRTIVAGPEIARRYGGDRPGLLVLFESVVRARDVAERPAERDWSGTLELLTVGRLDPEKNPFLLVDALACLEREQPGRFRVTWLGRGPLEDAVRQRAAELGVDDRIDLRGFVPYGDELIGLYRRAHMFVHVSLTEGVPKVLFEALAAGTPIVATDVGSVRVALDDGAAGLIVPPADLEALVEALTRISADADLRTRVASRGLELARGFTLEAQAERVANFIAAS